MALLFGNGLANGSPFYPGYEYTKPEISEPTGLLSLMTVMNKLGAETEYPKESSSTGTTGTGKEEVLHATRGTGEYLTGQLNDVEAGISQQKSLMYSTFMKNSGNLDKALSDSKQYRDNITKLYSERDKLRQASASAAYALDETYAVGKEIKDNKR